jgi:hypothetical protein
MAKTRGAPGALRGARRVREEAPGNGRPATTEPRPRADLTPVRRAVLLVAGDKSGNWRGWYDTAIPVADDCYDAHLAELETRTYE